MRLPILSLTAALIATAITPAAAQTKDERRMLALFERPPSELVPMIQVTGDSLDPNVTVTTRGVTAFVSKGLIASTTTENSWLRGFVDKKTGDVTAQVYQSISYGGRGFESFARATYEAPSGIEEAKVDQVGSDVSCYRYGCTHYADVVFTVSLDVLRAAAKAFDQNNPRAGLKYRIFGQSGTKIDDVIPGNELVAFVQVLDRESARFKK